MELVSFNHEENDFEISGDETEICFTARMNSSIWNILFHFDRIYFNII